MKIITLVVLFALFAFCAPAPLRASGLVVEKWKYDPETKMLSLKLVNTSGKIVTAYGLSVIHVYADGTTDALPDGRPSGSSSEEMLSGWISAEMRKGTPLEESIDSVGFAPEAVKYYTQPMLRDVVDVKATIDYVIYADCTAEVQNKLAFAWAVSSRKGELVGLQKVSEIIKQALADPAINDPVATARVEFERLFSIQARKGRIMSMNPESQPEPEPDPQALRDAISDLDSFPVVNSNLTPRESLEKYLAETEKHIALLLPHTQIALSSGDSNGIGLPQGGEA